MEKLQIGDTVKWSSQAQGWEKLKIGKVIGVVPTGEFALKTAQSIKERFSSACDFGAYPRDHESYLVLVHPEKGKALPKLYYPRVSALSKV